MSVFGGADSEVGSAFARGGGVQSIITAAAMMQQQASNNNAERSDDEESDHTPDPYATHMRGRVSPSPYTANTERARLFNSYVRGVIEQKLDVLVPISHQPRDLISEIIADSSARFPEFATCVRKRIRTFLKSYRRSRKLKDGSMPSMNGIGKMEDRSLSPTPDRTPPDHTSNTPVVTIFADSPHDHSNDDDIILPPESKKVRLTSPVPAPILTKAPPIIDSAGIMAAAAAAAAVTASSGNSQSLSNHEVQAVRQLISGYRESAAFLQRAADQLEAMLHNNSST